MEFDYKADIEGLVRGIAEEVSYTFPNVQDRNWSKAREILQRHYFRYFGYKPTAEEDKIVQKFTHELIAAKARRLHEQNPSRDSVANWLTAQKDLAVEIYLMDWQENVERVK